MNNQPTASLPAPLPSSVQVVTTPFWARAAWWTSAAGVVSSLGTYAMGLAAVFQSNPKAKMTLVLIAGALGATSALLGNLGSVLAGKAGTSAAAAVLEKHEADFGAGQDVFPPGTVR